MQSIEDFLNWLTDMDWGWWPILNFRPAKNEIMENSLLFKITPIFGTMAAIIALLLNLPVDTILIVTVLATCWALFFVFYKITFAAAWNRRAKRLCEAS